MEQLALRDVMSHEFVGVSEADALLDAVELMRSEHTTSAVVLRGNEPVGMVTAETVLDLLVGEDDPGSATVSDVMEGTPESLPPGASVAEAADTMERTSDPRVLVTDDDGVRGVVEARDVAPAITGRADRGRQPPTQARTVAADATGTNHTDDYADSSPTTNYAEQGVCESCGSLASELVNVNGRLLCTECRSV